MIVVVGRTMQGSQLQLGKSKCRILETLEVFDSHLACERFDDFDNHPAHSFVGILSLLVSERRHL